MFIGGHKLILANKERGFLLSVMQRIIWFGTCSRRAALKNGSRAEKVFGDALATATCL